MIFHLPNITNAAVEQRGLKQNQSVKMLTLVEAHPTKVDIARLFGESKKIVRHFCGTALLCNKDRDQAMIHRSRMDRTYAERRYPYVFSGPEYPLHLLGDLVTAGIYVWDSRKLVPKYGETGAQSRKSRINVYAAGYDPTVSAAAVPSNEPPAESKILDPDSIGETITNAPEPIEVCHNRNLEQNDGMGPMEAESAASLVSVMDDKESKSKSAPQLSCKN